MHTHIHTYIYTIFKSYVLIIYTYILAYTLCIIYIGYTIYYNQGFISYSFYKDLAKHSENIWFLFINMNSYMIHNFNARV